MEILFFFRHGGKTIFATNDALDFYEIEISKNDLLESRKRFDSFRDRKGYLYEI